MYLLGGLKCAKAVKCEKAEEEEENRIAEKVGIHFCRIHILKKINGHVISTKKEKVQQLNITKKLYDIQILDAKYINK